MSSSYKVTFTRWEPRRGERRQSGAHFFQAESFEDACEKAGLMLIGMRQVDAENTYTIASVEGCGYHSSIQCDGAGLWQTRAELKQELEDKTNA